MLTFVLSALLVSRDAPVAAAPAAPVAAEPVKKAKEKKICRERTEYTGSRMRSKQCLTEAEWAKRDGGASREDLKSLGSN